MTKRIHYCYLLTRAMTEGGCRYYVGIRTCPVGKTPETDTKYLGSGRWITRAVKAHRAEFTKTIVDVFDTRDEAKAMERALVGLATANSPWSYNLRQGGEDAGLLSEETKARISAGNHRRYEDPAEREKQGVGTRRRYADPSYKARHAAKLTEANRSLENRAKNSEGQRRSYARMTPEQRAARIQKAAEACRALARDPDWLAKNAAATRRPETRAKVSAAQRKLCEDPAERERRSARQLKRYANETPDQKAARRKAISEGRQRAKAERARVQREVQMILAALIVNKYGGAEAA